MKRIMRWCFCGVSSLFLWSETRAQEVAASFGTASTNGPRYLNDTVYTTKGYKIYEGQVLQFNKGTGPVGKFRFVRLDGGDEKRLLTDRKFTVQKIKRYEISDLGNAYIKINAKITYDDGSKGVEKLTIYFERALESFPGLPNEMLPPGQITTF